jgi:hypothetical protein
MSFAHDVLQPVVLQSKPPGQLPPVVDEQPPAPSQWPSQAAPQMTLLGGYVQDIAEALAHVP